jgi:hypothetical protein
MTAEILSLVPTVLAWGAMVYKIPAFRRDRHDPSVRAFALSLFFLALPFPHPTGPHLQHEDRSYSAGVARWHKFSPSHFAAWRNSALIEK